MYLFAISAIRSTILSIEHIPKEISSRRCTPLGSQRNISVWVYVAFHLQWSWKGNWLHSNPAPSLLWNLHTVPRIKIWSTATWPVQWLPFLYSDERAGKVCVASVGCVGAASCSFDSCSADRASHQEIGIISARSRQKDAGFPLIFWTIQAGRQGFRKMLGSEIWNGGFFQAALPAFLNIFRVVFEPAALSGLLPKDRLWLEILPNLESFICVWALPCGIGDSGLSILRCFQLERENIVLKF